MFSYDLQLLPEMCDGSQHFFKITDQQSLIKISVKGTVGVIRNKLQCKNNIARVVNRFFKNDKCPFFVFQNDRFENDRFSKRFPLKNDRF